MKRIKVAVVTGGASPEHEIALRSGRTVIHHLPAHRFQVRAVKIQRNGSWCLLEDGGGDEALFKRKEGAAPEGVMAALRDWGLDVAFLALHGPGGEDGAVQGFLHTLGIPFTGAGIEASAVSMNKELSKVLAQRAGLSVPEGTVLGRGEWRSCRRSWIARLEEKTGFPLYVKPLHQGSSLGAGRADSPSALEHALDHAFEFEEQVLAERAIQGREITCGVVGEGEGWHIPLPSVEIRPKTGSFFDFESKYDPARAEEICPAPLDGEQAMHVADGAVRAFRALGARGMARIDFILAPEGLYFLELNSIPGLTPESILIKELRAAGISLDTFLSSLVISALGDPFPALIPGTRAFSSSGAEPRGGAGEEIG